MERDSYRSDSIRPDLLHTKGLVGHTTLYLDNNDAVEVLTHISILIVQKCGEYHARYFDIAFRLIIAPRDQSDLVLNLTIKG